MVATQIANDACRQRIADPEPAKMQFVLISTCEPQVLHGTSLFGPNDCAR